jgi:hypothetical protein
MDNKSLLYTLLIFIVCFVLLYYVGGTYIVDSIVEWKEEMGIKNAPKTTNTTPVDGKAFVEKSFLIMSFIISAIVTAALNKLLFR